jgi:hypothetical protein
MSFWIFIRCVVLGIHKYAVVSQTQFNRKYVCELCGHIKYEVLEQ